MTLTDGGPLIALIDRAEADPGEFEALGPAPGFAVPLHPRRSGC
jgi:hypothetical protein